MSQTTDTARIRRVFDKPELHRLVDQLQKRLERGTNSLYLTLSAPAIKERKAIAALLGRPIGDGRSIRIAIEDLEHVIQRSGLAPDLRTAVEQLRGPLKDVTAEKMRRRQAWEEIFEATLPAVNKLGIQPWLSSIKKSGLLKRLAQDNPEAGKTLLQQALSVVSQLPGHGQTLSTLAANALGDAHALDSGRPVATLVKRVIGRREATIDNTNREESDRELWANAGIVVGGAITSTVLILNMPVKGGSSTADIIRQANREGQPIWLTLRQLVRNPPRWAVTNRPVYVCENPAVIAEAADRFGRRSAPLACTAGQPCAAVNHLLRQLCENGATLHYHGDFDWPGVRIANTVIRRFGAHTWNFDKTAYRRAIELGSVSLQGRPVTAEWDPGLTRAMKEKNIAIPEERVLEMLWDTLYETQKQ